MKAIALAALVASGAFGQCVMCNRTAAAQNAERARVFNMGILILLAPPFAILGGLVALARTRDRS
jgi:hypothetical protein